jgi:hypothetical protein
MSALPSWQPSVSSAPTTMCWCVAMVRSARAPTHSPVTQSARCASGQARGTHFPPSNTRARPQYAFAWYGSTQAPSTATRPASHPPAPGGSTPPVLARDEPHAHITITISVPALTALTLSESPRRAEMLTPSSAEQTGVPPTGVLRATAR